jgi:hypothetical protein
VLALKAPLKAPLKAKQCDMVPTAWRVGCSMPVPAGLPAPPLYVPPVPTQVHNCCDWPLQRARRTVPSPTPACMCTRPMMMR